MTPLHLPESPQIHLVLPSPVRRRQAHEQPAACRPPPAAVLWAVGMDVYTQERRHGLGGAGMDASPSGGLGTRQRRIPGGSPGTGAEILGLGAAVDLARVRARRWCQCCCGRPSPSFHNWPQRRYCQWRSPGRWCGSCRPGWSTRVSAPSSAATSGGRFRFRWWAFSLHVLEKLKELAFLDFLPIGV